MSSLNSVGGGSTRSIFPQGPSFTLENFSNKDFIVRDFIEDLAESAAPVNRRSGPAQQAFDSKPLIRTFESKLCAHDVWVYANLSRCFITACEFVGRVRGEGDGSPDVCKAR